MKRPHPGEEVQNHASKTKKLSHEAATDVRRYFRSEVFDAATQKHFKAAYGSARPYPHGVIPSVIEPNLLSAVRHEIITHVAFTPKETDIYRIHQSGDLANLSNLDAESLQHLPSLLKLRDALYSYEFRKWICEVCSVQNVSGRKTDMAVNVYTPGSYLLCHDDVIGSRKISYILYLTDPDDLWDPSWGGNLRLYPTESKVSSAGGKAVKVPLPDHNMIIPPSFGQLGFFAVQPGESYHDVEEVYHGKERDDDKRRVRMAISGWYHTPQLGEEGYQEGEVEKQVQNSSLAQLEGVADEFDEPAPLFRHFDEPRIVPASDGKSGEIDPGDHADLDESILSEQDLTFLLQYLTPSFLTPEMTEKFAASFEENSFLQLDQVLNENVSTALKGELAAEQDHEADGAWKVARPPHKHRYLYLRQDEAATLDSDKNLVSKLLTDLLHSHAFKKWLAIVTGFRPHTLLSQNVMARRFRRGKDYALASGYHKEVPCLEFSIGLTPSSGWEETEDRAPGVNSKSTKKAMDNAAELKYTETKANPGGEEVYMAGDDEDDSPHSKALPHVGKRADPAIYRSTEDDAEDSILFASPPSWNTFSVVLRDQGTLRFVKYVSQAAPGDRWDIKGEVELSQEAFDGEEEALEEGEDDFDEANDESDDENDEEDDEDEDE